MVTTAGGVEEDFIKCLAPTYVGDFHLSGRDLRDRGINRIGNLLAPNDNYCKFEDWVMPILDDMVTEQKEQVCSATRLCFCNDSASSEVDVYSIGSALFAGMLCDYCDYCICIEDAGTFLLLSML